LALAGLRRRCSVSSMPSYSSSDSKTTVRAFWRVSRATVAHLVHVLCQVLSKGAVGNVPH
jgi:hypothetical protein